MCCAFSRISFTELVVPELPGLDASVEDALARLSGSRLSWKDRLGRRIAELNEMFVEHYPGKKVSVRSINSLIDFLDLLPSSPEYPDVTLTPNGDLYVEWRRRDGRHIMIEFLDSGKVRWTVLGPNPRHPDLIDRLNGTTTADALGETIRPLSHLTGIAA